MEKKVFTDPAVAGVLNGMVESRVHNDLGNQDEIRAWQIELINSFATPAYVLVDPVTGAVIDTHYGPEMDPAMFATWLRKAIAKG